MSDQNADSRSRSDVPDVPPALLAHDTGLTLERLRELFAADDAYTRRPSRDDDDA